jgi:hypothetical protein
MSRLSVAGWGLVLSLLAYLAGHLVRNEGLLNLAYKVPVLTYGPLLMIAIHALVRRGSFPAILAGTITSVAAALTFIILIRRNSLQMDEFWIYPLSCLIFVLSAVIAGRFRKPKLQNP